MQRAPLDRGAGTCADLRLLAAARGGEPAALDELVRRLGCVREVLGGLNRRAGGNFASEELSDLAQDAQVLIWMRLERYTGEAPLESWFAGFCANVYRNALRRRARRPVHEGIDPQQVSGASAVRSAELEHLLRNLARLDSHEARIIRLKVLTGLTFTEIGRRLGVSPNSAKTCYYRGLRRLAELLRREA